MDPVQGQIVSIACPDKDHAAYVKWALDEGSHVFCEKPLYVTEKQGASIKELLSKTHVAQNFPLRHVNCFKNLKREDFGEIYRIDAVYNWGRTEKLNEGWRKEDPNYSLVMGGLIHIVDLIVWLTGLNMEVISVIGVNKSAPDFPNYDTVTAQCRLSNGGVCNLTIDGGSGVLAHHHILHISGTKRSVHRVNNAQTNKQAAIKKFVQDIRAGTAPLYELRAVDICLEIEKRASISADRF